MAQKKITLTATLPDGRTATRTTARTYTHAVAVLDEKSWGVLAWCGRPDLAAKRAEQARNCTASDGTTHWWKEVQIIEVN